MEHSWGYSDIDETDVLVATDSDRDWNACLNYAPDRAYLYAAGYRKGAESIFHELSNGTIDQDYLVYPLVFLWRQHAELMLKNLLKKAIMLTGTPCESWGHNILSLWRDLCGYCDVLPRCSRYDVNAVERILTELHEIDESSAAFRYPTKADGTPILDRKVTHISLRVFHGTMEKVAEFFDALDTGWRELIQWRADARSEYAP